MKARYVVYTVGLAMTMLVATGCSSVKMGAGGAAAGAASAGFLGAVTDLIVDGSVNTDRLERNLVSGALAGGTAGAVAGARKDQQQAAAKPPKPTEPDQEMIKKIGNKNHDALVSLINYRHEDAYRMAVKGGDTKNQEHQEASYAIRALIDKDRGNADGMADALNSFVELDGDVGQADAQKGLNDLHQGLEDERKAQGVWKKQ